MMQTTKRPRLRLGQGGSLNNRMAECGVVGMPEPEVGMGATILMYTDRHAATIVQIRKNKAGRVMAVAIVEDNAIRTDTNGFSESQTYRYEPGQGEVRWYSRRNTGQFIRQGDSVRSGQVISIGVRNEYRDPNF